MKKLLPLLALLLIGCGTTYDVVYNQPVERSTIQINYQYGIYGFGYYDRFGRFYGPNNINYYVPRQTIIIRPRRTAVSSTRRGSSPAPRPRGTGGRSQATNAQ